MTYTEKEIWKESWKTYGKIVEKKYEQKYGNNRVKGLRTEIVYVLVTELYMNAELYRIANFFWNAELYRIANFFWNAELYRIANFLGTLNCVWLQVSFPSPCVFPIPFLVDQTRRGNQFQLVWFNYFLYVGNLDYQKKDLLVRVQFKICIFCGP